MQTNAGATYGSKAPELLVVEGAPRAAHGVGEAPCSLHTLALCKQLEGSMRVGTEHASAFHRN